MDSRNLTTNRIPRIAAEEIKDTILGKEYDLSVVYADNKLTHELNAKYRGKDKPANVLSFPLSKTEGEIFLNIEMNKDSNEITYLFIHGLLHLKGLDHGSIMDAREEKFKKKFLIEPDVKNPDNRNRCRDFVGTRRSRGVRKGQS